MNNNLKKAIAVSSAAAAITFIAISIISMYTILYYAFSLEDGHKSYDSEHIADDNLKIEQFIYISVGSLVGGVICSGLAAAIFKSEYDQANILPLYLPMPVPITGEVIDA